MPHRCFDEPPPLCVEVILIDSRLFQDNLEARREHVRSVVFVVLGEVALLPSQGLELWSFQKRASYKRGEASGHGKTRVRAHPMITLLMRVCKLLDPPSLWRLSLHSMSFYSSSLYLRWQTKVVGFTSSFHTCASNGVPWNTYGSPCVTSVRVHG